MRSTLCELCVVWYDFYCVSLQLQLHQPGTSGGGGGGGGSGHSSRGQGQQRGAGRTRAPIGPLKPEQVAKMLSELDLVRKNMDIMSEIMNENEPGKENQEDIELLDVCLSTSSSHCP